MSDNISYINQSDFFSETVSASPVEVKKDVLSRVLKIFIAALGFFLAGEILYYICIIPAAAAPLVSVDGLVHATRDDVYRYSGSLFDVSWLDIDPVALATRISQCPMFESVDVKKVFPDKLIISVTERTAAASSFMQIKGKTVPVQIDVHGYVFRTGYDGISDSCVIISGIDFSEMQLGDRVQPEVRSFIANFAAMQSAAEPLCKMISEVKVDSSASGRYEFVLYPAHIPVPMRTFGQLNVDTLQYMMLVLDVIEQFNIDTDELDFRSGTVVYKSRGGVHE